MARLLNFSLLVPYHYCKYQVYLSEYLKIKAPVSQALITGLKKHKQLEQEFLLEAEEIEIPLPELVGRVLEGLEPAFITREIPLVSRSLMLKGRVDELEVHADKAVVTDDKPRLSEGGKSQVLAYSLAFREQFLFPGKIMAKVRHRDTKEELWTEWLSKSYVRRIKREAAELHAIAEGKEPEPCKDPVKCARCRYKLSCPARQGKQ